GGAEPGQAEVDGIGARIVGAGQRVLRDIDGRAGHRDAGRVDLVENQRAGEPLTHHGAIEIDVGAVAVGAGRVRADDLAARIEDDAGDVEQLVGDVNRAEAL